jgi:hypothetical protein
MALRFGAWAPLETAVAPDGPGLLQIRRGQGSDGIRDYPRGRSAMVDYDADDVAVSAALARACDRLRDADGPLFVRFAPPERGVAPSRSLEFLIDDFSRRFGAPPAPQ